VTTRINLHINPHPVKGMTVSRSESTVKTFRSGPRLLDASPALPCLCGLAACVAILLALLFAVAASADTRIGEPGSAAGQINETKGLAVSAREGGDIYIDDEANQRVDQFEPDGTFVRAFGWGVVPGAAAGTGSLTKGSDVVTDVTTTSGAFSESGGPGKLITGPGIPPGTTITAVGPNEFASLNLGELVLSNPVELSLATAPITVAAGTGNLPTDERQQLSVEATGGEFALTFISPKPDTSTLTTTAIPFDAPPSGSGSVQQALEGLSNIGPANVAVTGPAGGPYTVEFTGRFADVNVRRLSAEDVDLSGGASEVTVTTPVEGGGTLETCTVVCGLPSAEENAGASGNGFGGSRPGQLDSSDEIAVDNDPSSGSYGDLYLVDQRNFRVEKFGPEGAFLLMFGGGVDKTTGADLCTAEDVNADHDTCGAGVPGTGPAHFYKEEPETQAGGFKSWANAGSNSIAVGPDGTVYIGDYGRIQEFTPAGTFAGEFVLPLAAGEEPQFVIALALDSAGDLFERSATYSELEGFEAQIPGVREFGPGPAHAFIRTFDASAEEGTSEPTHIALDAAGDLFAADYHDGEFDSSTEEVFRAFRPTGALYAEFSSPQVQLFLPKAHPNDPGGIAIGDAAGALYVSSPLGEGRNEPHIAAIPLPRPGPPAVTALRLTDLEPETATLHAVVNPEQFDTGYRLQYIAEARLRRNEEEGHEAFAGAESTALTDLGPISREDPVSAPISSLSAATAYRWRVLATNSEGTTEPEGKFETLPDVSVRDFTTQTVAPEEVLLKAELNNNNSLGAGHYEICIGADAGSYTKGCSEGTLKAGGGEFEKFEASFANLEPNTPYHYRLTAHNSYGEVKTVDAEFTTEPSAAEEGAAEAAACDNVTLRQEDDSTTLPDCRAYEQVSPAYKAGYPVGETNALAPDGERDYFTAVGSFAGSNQNRLVGFYVAHRTAAGWVTGSPIGPPAGSEYQPSEPVGFDAELDTSLFTALPGSTSLAAGQAGTGDPVLYLGHPDGSFLAASPPLAVPSSEHPVEFAGQSADYSRVILASNYKLLPTDPRPNSFLSFHGNDRLYELDGIGGPSPTLRLVAEVPPGLPGGCLIDNYFGQSTDPLSADGSMLFYDAPVELHPGLGCVAGRGAGAGPNPSVLFARAGEAPPVPISTPPASQCHSPHPCAAEIAEFPQFYGASPNGDLAWFTTAQPLIDSDADEADDLYLAKLEGGELKELVQASAGEAAPTHPTPGDGAGVKGVVRISADGTHAAFVATGVLTARPNPSTGQSAVQGADNLYLYDATTAETKFVADLCTGPEESGSAADLACPLSVQELGRPGELSDAQLWTVNVGSSVDVDQARLTPDGRFLLFTSYGRLVSGDTDSARDVYRYDFSTGALLRLSLGRDGNDGDGNDDAYNAEIHGLSDLHSEAYRAAEDLERAISSNGSIAIFETTAPLVSHDTNAGADPGCHTGTETGCDVYEWEESGHGSCHEAAGCVRLITSGTDPHSVTGAVLSASGRDISFATPAPLLPADTDGVADVYDAREGGGFPYLPPEKSCGGNETCHEAAPSPPAPPKITSGGETGGNGAGQLQCAKGRHRVTKHGQARCVPDKHKRHKKKPRKRHKHKRSHKQTANRNRGAGR
jgi:hypothetical protein